MYQHPVAYDYSPPCGLYSSFAVLLTKADDKTLTRALPAAMKAAPGSVAFVFPRKMLLVIVTSDSPLINSPVALLFCTSAFCRQLYREAMSVLSSCLLACCSLRLWSSSNALSSVLTVWHCEERHARRWLGRGDVSSSKHPDAGHTVYFLYGLMLST